MLYNEINEKTMKLLYFEVYKMKFISEIYKNIVNYWKKFTVSKTITLYSEIT